MSALCPSLTLNQTSNSHFLSSVHLANIILFSCLSTHIGLRSFTFLVFPLIHSDSHNHPSVHLFTLSPGVWHDCRHPENAWHGVWPVGTTYLRHGMAGLWGKCGACATQQPCLMSSKWLQTWTLIHSVMRRPQSDGSAAGCQVCPSTHSGSDRAQWGQTLGFKGNHCNFNEIVFP